MNRFFSKRLYVEGLKKVRLSGIATAIICITLTALVPMVTMIESAGSNENVTTLGIGYLAVPLLLIFFFAPMLVQQIFSFLDKRSESDFYHSIPYRRECVYFSFFAAVLTWIWGIVLASSFAAGLLWTVSPNTAFLISDLLRLAGIYLIGATLYAGMMATAMSLTGTAAGNLTVFAVFACGVRAVGACAVAALCELCPVFVPGNSIFAFLNAEYCLPIDLLTALWDGAQVANTLGNARVLAYNIVLAVVFVALGCVCYCFRRSETAGMSAASGKLQHVFRCAFAAPLAVLTTYFILTGVDAGLVVTMAVLSLLTYFLYELATTKSVKKMFRATPALGILLAVCLVFAAGVLGGRESVLSKTVDKNDVASISKVVDVSRNVSYTEILTRDVECTDAEAISVVCDALNDSVALIKNGTYNVGRYYETEYDVETGEKTEYYYSEGKYKIRLKNGVVYTRNVCLRSDKSDMVADRIGKSGDDGQSYLQIPNPSEVSYVYVAGMDVENEKELYRTFYEEYEALDDAQKSKVRSGTDGVRIHVDGTHDLIAFEDTYFIPVSMEKTVRRYVESAMRLTETEGGEQVKKTLGALAEMSKEEAEKCRWELNLTCYGEEHGKICCYYSFYKHKETADTGLLTWLSQLPDNTSFDGKWIEIDFSMYDGNIPLPNGYTVQEGMCLRSIIYLTDEEYNTFWKRFSSDFDGDDKVICEY